MIVIIKVFKHAFDRLKQDLEKLIKHGKGQPIPGLEGIIFELSIQADGKFLIICEGPAGANSNFPCLRIQK